MRVAYVCTDRGVRVFGRRGSSIHVQEIVRRFLRDGHEVHLFATRLGGDVPRGLEDAIMHRLPAPSTNDATQRAQAALDNNDILRTLLEQKGPFDLVYERHALWSYGAMEFARTSGVPSVLEVNAPLLEEQRRYRELVMPEVAEDAADRAFDAAGALVAVSEGLARFLARRPSANGRVHVVPNGVDPSRFAPRGSDRADASFTVGFVGTLKPWHAVDDLVNAFAQLVDTQPDARLMIVGDGPNRETLAQHVADHGIDNAVTFTGLIDPDDMPGILADMDVAVAPYPVLESFYFSPLKVFEYMASARAVVAARIGQLEGVITHGINGLLYEPGDVDGLARAIKYLHEAPEYRHSLGAAARRAVETRHTWDDVLLRIRALATTRKGTTRSVPS